jgi:phosphoribosylglycinamide formyltransferase-1
MPDLSRLVVLISGNGSNLQAILDACASGELPAQVVGVVSNKPQAYGLVRARRAFVPTRVFPFNKGDDRRAYDTWIADYVVSLTPSWVVLAGWMRILTPAFLNCFQNRVINLHPALPGTFPGTHAIERASAAWQRGEIDRTGVMVHLVPDEGVDAGPVLGKEEIFFQPGEPPEQFENRVHEVEHRLLVDTMKKLILDSVVTKGKIHA